MSEFVRLTREHIERLIKKAELLDDGGDGADPETARSIAEGLRAALAQEAGKGEPVAYSFKAYVWATGLGAYVWRDKLETERPDIDNSEIKDLIPLYASLPAPVSVVLPARYDQADNGIDCFYCEDIEEMLELAGISFKELNP